MKRFWSKVDKRGPAPKHRPHLGRCWIWAGALTANGYGWFNYRVRNNEWQPRLAHRIAWFLAHGGFPSLHVLHHCDNPKCVRLKHLYLGTQKENIRDMIHRGRGKNFSNMPLRDQRGSKNHGAILTEAQVAKIRRDRENGFTLKQLTEKYGYRDLSGMSKICRRITWRHVA